MPFARCAQLPYIAGRTTPCIILPGVRARYPHMPHRVSRTAPVFPHGAARACSSSTRHGVAPWQRCSAPCGGRTLSAKSSRAATPRCPTRSKRPTRAMRSTFATRSHAGPRTCTTRPCCSWPSRVCCWCCTLSHCKQGQGSARARHMLPHQTLHISNEVWKVGFKIPCMCI